MKITAVNSTFDADSIRSMVNSILQNESANRFGFSTATGTLLATPIGSVNTVVLGVDSSLPAAFTNGTIHAYTSVGGQLDITGLSTSGLPNNRQYWADFGQLCEDVFFGRIPELSDAAVLILDQNTSEIVSYDATGGGFAMDGGDLQNSSIGFAGTEDTASEDFFEG